MPVIVMPGITRRCLSYALSENRIADSALCTGARNPENAIEHLAIIPSRASHGQRWRNDILDYLPALVGKHVTACIMVFCSVNRNNVATMTLRDHTPSATYPNQPLYRQCTDISPFPKD